MCLLLAFAIACTPARRKVQTDVVASVGFVGNGGFFEFEQGDYALAGAMEQKASSTWVNVFPMMYWVSPAAYDAAALDRDAWRLEVWYAHHGWFDARFLGWEVIRTRPRRSDMAGLVRIRGHVDPGEPSLVREYAVEGLDAPIHRQFRNAVIRNGALRVGARFDMDAVAATRTYALDLLSNRGFPYAAGDAALAVYPEDHAVDVALQIEPGPLANFGEVRILGAEHVSDFVIRDTLPFASGDIYDSRMLGKAQQRIFQLGTFAVVNVAPDLSDPTRDEVPVDVTVTEAQFQTLRFGGGLSYQGAMLTPRLSVTYRHANLFHRLIQVQAKGSFGYGFRPRAGGVGLLSGTPVYALDVDVSTPRLGSSDLGMFVGASVKQDVQSGQYTYFNPKARAGVTWRPSAVVVASFGPQFELYQFLDLSREGLLISRQLFGESFQNPYLLTKLTAQLTLDWRDDPISATRGTYYGVGVEQALPVDKWVGGADEGFLYTQISWDVRGYTKLSLRSAQGSVPLSGALRFQGKGIIPWAGNAYLPYPEKAFLGGANTLRGFLVDQVGPYDTICTHEPGQHGDPFSGVPGAGMNPLVRHLPKGGAFGASVMSELRYALTESMRVAAFADVGLLIDQGQQVGAGALRFGGGLGVRYDTPIGPIRLDLAARPLYPEDGGPREMPGCLPSDGVLPRSSDLFGALFPKQRIADMRVVPLAVNIYLAIGEAF